MALRWAALFFCAVILTAGCTGGGDTAADSEGKLEVHTSLYPLAFFAEKIGGKHVNVTNLVPTGVEPHDFEPTAKDLAKLSESDVFLYNGAGFEAWVEKARKIVDPKQTLVVDTTRSMDLLPAEEKEEHDHHGEEEKEADGHDHGDLDPHVWLDPLRAKQQAAAIRDALVKKDPQHKRDYEANYDKLAKQLEELHRTIQKTVEKGERKEFIVSHAAFGYLADRYGLKQVAISGLSPSDEPSPKELGEIIREAREHQVKYIFFETLVSAKVAKVVKEEVGAEALVLNPLEGLTQEEKARGEDYFSIMKQNANHLGKALGATR